MARAAKRRERPARLSVVEGLSVVDGGAQRAGESLPALGLAVIDRRQGEDWLIRSGKALRPATLADNVEEAFAEECMRDRRTVLVTSGGAGPAVIVGALQTARTASRDAHDTLSLAGRRVSIDAGQELTLRAGKSVIRIDKHGVIRVRGQKMSMDVATVVRIMSALVELP